MADTSGKASRFTALGQTDAGRLLFVVFTLRGSLIRVISGLEEIKPVANKRDVPYQSILKVFLAERVEQ